MQIKGVQVTYLYASESTFTNNYILKLKLFQSTVYNESEVQTLKQFFWKCEFSAKLKLKILDWFFWFVFSSIIFSQFLNFSFYLLFSAVVSFKSFQHFFIFFLAYFFFCIFLLRFPSLIFSKRKSATNKVKMFYFLWKSYMQTSETLPLAKINTTIK